MFRNIKDLEDNIRDVFWYIGLNDDDIVESVAGMYGSDILIFNIEDIKQAKAALVNSSLTKGVAENLRNTAINNIKETASKFVYKMDESMKIFRGYNDILLEVIPLYNEELVNLDATQVQHLGVVLERKEETRYFNGSGNFIRYVTESFAEQQYAIEAMELTGKYVIDMHLALFNNISKETEDENVKNLVNNAITAFKALELNMPKEGTTDTERLEEVEYPLTTAIYRDFKETLVVNNFKEMHARNLAIVTKIVELQKAFVGVIIKATEIHSERGAFGFFSNSSVELPDTTLHVHNVKMLAKRMKVILETIKQIKGK